MGKVALNLLHEKKTRNPVHKYEIVRMSSIVNTLVLLLLTLLRYLVTG